MIGKISQSESLAADVNDLTALKKAAKENSPEALRETAKQFEALFVNMVLKSMRDATPKDGIFDSEQGKMFGSMLDQQLSQTMASRGVGLTDVLVKQLSIMSGSLDKTSMENAPSPSEGQSMVQQYRKIGISK